MVRPPGPKTLVPGGHLLAFQLRPINFLMKVARNYGDISYFRLGPQPAYLLNHPDFIKDVLVTRHENFMKGRALQRSKRLLGEGLLTSEGAAHRRQRRLAQPAFHRQRISTYARVMVDYAERFSERWQVGTSLDIAHEMSKLTLAIVGKTLFDTDVESDAEGVGQALTKIMKQFRLLLLPYTELLEFVPLLPPVRRFREAKDELDRVIYRIIEERRRSKRDHGDLLSMLLMAQDDEEGSGGMTDEQLRDEALTIFLAGHETTANWLTWTWYLLSAHPEAEIKLHEELDRVLGGKPPSDEDIPQLRYTEMILSEAMRLYPPAWTVGRLAISDTEVGGYMVPAGSLVLLSQYVMHHDERYYPDPFRFDPERWTPEAKGERPQFAYFPFGGGPRRCIGEGFALMEGALLLATLAQKWRMRLVPGHPVDIHPLITLRPKHGMLMKLEKVGSRQ
ncbi:MAG: cytochrome P450 [Pyrinomonadaceae bacterium]|nr:cytochrome P450 [Pyrinomonadaceae bacterium]